MPYTISPIANHQFFDSNGNPLSGGQIFTYLAGTSTKVATHKDILAAADHTNPIVLNVSGMPPDPIYLLAGLAYKFILAPADDTDPPSSPMYTWDNISTVDPATLTVEQWVTGTTPSYVAVNSFTLVGNQTGVYHVGRRVKLESTIGTLYGTIFASTFGVTTSVLVVLDSGNLDATLHTVSYAVLTATGSSLPGMSHSGYNVTITAKDTRTNAVVTPLTVTADSIGTSAAGMGTGILLRAKSADESPSDVGQVEAVFSDPTAASEDSYIQFLMRVAGAALTACYRFVATGAFKAIFTHANSADRTYTLQNSSDTLVGRATTDTLTNKTFDAQGTGNSLANVSTSALKTATGSASGSQANPSSIDITLNDYSFSPNIQETSPAAGLEVRAIAAADSGTTVPRFNLSNPTGAGTTNYHVRWRYVTASDDPTIWVGLDASGVIVGVWVSDDPTSDGTPGLSIPGGSSILLKSADIEVWSELSEKAAEAADHIRDRKLKMKHQAFRALQLLTNEAAPSKWLYDNCKIVRGKVTLGK